MNVLKEHIIFKSLTFALVIALFTPTGVKLAHLFEHHEHIVCSDESSTHFHQVDLDCKFQEFNLNTHYLFSFEYDDFIRITSFHKVSILTYKFLNNHRPLSFSLRGPPALV